MNKNDKFHGADFEASAQAISDDELDTVSGGYEISEMPDDWQEGINPVGAITEA